MFKSFFSGQKITIIPQERDSVSQTDPVNYCQRFILQ